MKSLFDPCSLTILLRGDAHHAMAGTDLLEKSGGTAASHLCSCIATGSDVIRDLNALSDHRQGA
jgi:hypothetical protein